MVEIAATRVSNEDQWSLAGRDGANIHGLRGLSGCRAERSNSRGEEDAPPDDARPQKLEHLLPVGTLVRVAHRVRAKADSGFADVRQRPSDREAVIRLTAMASTLNWVASEIEALETKFRGRASEAD